MPTSGLLPECSTVSLNVLVNQSYRDLQIVCSAKSHFRRLSGAPCTSQFLRNCSQCLALGDQTVFVTYRITVTTELWHSAGRPDDYAARSRRAANYIASVRLSVSYQLIAEERKVKEFKTSSEIRLNFNILKTPSRY